MSKKRADNNQPVLIDESLIGEAEERFNGAGPNVTSNAPIRPEWTVNQRELRSRCGRYTHSHTPAPTHTATHPAIHPLRYPPAPSHTRPHTGFDTHPLPHTPGHTPASIPTRWYTHRRHHTTARVCGSVCVSDGRNVLSHRFVDPPDRLFTFSINRREEELNNCRFISELAVALQFPHPSYSVLLLPHPTGECWKSFWSGVSWRWRHQGGEDVKNLGENLGENPPRILKRLWRDEVFQIGVTHEWKRRGVHGRLICISKWVTARLWSIGRESAQHLGESRDAFSSTG